MYEEKQKKTLWDWINQHAEEIIFVGGIYLAYKVGQISGYTLGYRDLTKLVRGGR